MPEQAAQQTEQAPADHVQAQAEDQDEQRDQADCELILGKPWLFSRLYQFNYSPADYLHPSQRERFLPLPQWEELWRSPRARPGLSLYILEKLSLSQRASFDDRLPWWPLFLLDHERLQRLARHVAASVLGPQVRRAMARTEVLRWKEQLGAELHSFAMNGAAFLPEPGLEPAWKSGHSLDSLGYSWIDSALASSSEALLERFRLKYPARCELAPVAQDKAMSMTRAVLKILEKRWHSSFAQKLA